MMMKKHGMMIRAVLLAAAISTAVPAGALAAETKAAESTVAEEQSAASGDKSVESAVTETAESAVTAEKSAGDELESTVSEEETAVEESTGAGEDSTEAGEKDRAEDSSAAAGTRAAEVEAPAAKTELKDGDYMVEVTLEGGSGRATVTSPTGIRVKDGTAIAAIQFSSPNYDYMIVAGKQYKKLNDDGNSIFNIPILAFDEPFPVIADTTAMDKPHEIEYTLNFHTDTAQKVEKEDKLASFGPYIFGAGIVVFMLLFQKYMNKKKN